MKSFITRLIQPKTFAKLLSFDYLLPIMLLSFAAWYISYVNNLVMVYNDAMSHINIARLVIDNREPGLSQMGSVWLPLNHILPIVFVWNDWAWHSGFAGSIFSMLSYVVSVWAIYKTVFVFTKKKIASFIGGLAFALNLNMLYLQTTPLTEPLYIAIFSLSVYVFALWLQAKNDAATKYLLLLGVLGFFQVIARYDGWFVVLIQGLLIGIHELFIARSKIHVFIGKLALYGLPVSLGVLLWLLWNGLIFGDPFYFAFGPYSAHAQQQVIEQSAGLITKGNVINSFLAYFYAVLHNVGLFVLIYAFLGIIILFGFVKNQFSFIIKTLFLILLVSPIMFNILALYLGFSILNIPELNWNPSNSIAGQWFNVRYGLLALPFAAIMYGIFAGWSKLGIFIAMLMLIAQTYATYTQGVITLTDGTIGSSAYRNHDLADALQAHVQKDDTVLMSLSVFNPVAFDSKIQLKQIIHEGVSKQWIYALEKPEKYAEWVVVNNTHSDAVSKSVLTEEKSTFLNNYKIIYVGKEASIYQKI